jgi:hypothetical protein
VGHGKRAPRRDVSIHVAGESGHDGVIAVEWPARARPRKIPGRDDPVTLATVARWQ